MIIGEKIKEMIRKSNFTVENVAEKLGMTKQNMHTKLKKDSIETKYLEQIAEFLSVPITAFFSDTEPVPVPETKKTLVEKSFTETELLKKEIVGLQREIEGLKRENDGLKRENDLLREFIDLLKQKSH